jgi:hypothetical protein
MVSGKARLGGFSLPFSNQATVGLERLLLTILQRRSDQRQNGWLTTRPGGSHRLPLTSGLRPMD